MHQISKAFAIAMSLFGPAGQLAAADLTVDQFFKLVATGAATDVLTALQQQPELAVSPDTSGCVAVHNLDYIGFAKKLGALQQFGADINARNDEGKTMLHTIIDPEFVPVAMAAGADINMRDHKGRSPIMTHLQESDGLDFVPSLIAAGADVNTRDDTGKSVLDYARAFDRPDLIAVLKRAGAIE